jgi:hypothetical protein
MLSDWWGTCTAVVGSVLNNILLAYSLAINTAPQRIDGTVCSDCRYTIAARQYYLC